MKSTEQQLAEAQGKITSLEAENKQLKESAVATQKAAVQSELSRLMSEAKLPEPAQKRLQQHFAEAIETKDLSAAVIAEAEYIKTLTVGTSKKNLGAADNGGNVQESEKQRHAELVESFKAMGLTEEQALLAAK